MTIADKTVLVTGASRGIGRALAAEALARNARQVYAGTRRPLAHPDARVTPLMLDVTSPDQVQAAVGEVRALDLLINNAGILLRDDLTDPAAIERHLAVNLFGTYAMTQAFLPALCRSGGTIVNILSVNSLAPMPLMPAYSISKAAAFSLTPVAACPSGRAGGAGSRGPGRPGGHRHAPGGHIPKASPESVAAAVFDAVEKNEEDIFPDPVSAFIADNWRDGATKALERQFAQAVHAAL
jgi:NAD(P)-dependent dehydrogenase (short-subunit alcohol dehydrogenase family)